MRSVSVKVWPRLVNLVGEEVILGLGRKKWNTEYIMCRKGQHKVK